MHVSTCFWSLAICLMLIKGLTFRQCSGPPLERLARKGCHCGLGLAAESLKSKPWRDSLGLSYLRSLRPNLTFLELCYLSCYASSLNS